MQGWSDFIPTEKKVEFLNTLLTVGFDTLDFGSFVSPKVIPQMTDSAEVLPHLNIGKSKTKLLAIVANERGAEEAMTFKEITYLGYPFSISETFQKKNTNKTIKESFRLVKRLQTLCDENNKKLVIYISMGFGNPYGEPYNKTVVGEWTDRLSALGIRIISLSDTVGVANPETIADLYAHLVPAYPEIEFGAHFHSTPWTRDEKIEAAFDNGCRRFDGAVRGYGGCPMAEDELIGNMATEQLIAYFEKRNAPVSYNKKAFERALDLASEIFV